MIDHSLISWRFLVPVIAVGAVILAPLIATSEPSSRPGMRQLGTAFPANPQPWHRRAANIRPRARLTHLVLLPQLGTATHLGPRRHTDTSTMDIGPRRSISARSCSPWRQCSGVMLAPDDRPLTTGSIDPGQLIRAPSQRDISFGDYQGIAALGIPVLVDVPPIVIINPPRQEKPPFLTFSHHKAH